jgi:hypothetical protein
MIDLEEMLEKLILWQKIDALPPSPQTTPVVSHCAVDFLRDYAPAVRVLVNDRILQLRSLH